MAIFLQGLESTQPSHVLPHLMSTPSSTVPTAASDRLAAIDVLRGVAVLGILPMNIICFALPGITGVNPTIAGGFSGGNFLV